MVSCWSSMSQSIFSFSDDNLSRYQWTKLSIYIVIVEIWFAIANGQTLSVLTQLPAHHTIVVGYYWFMILFYISDW